MKTSVFCLVLIAICLLAPSAFAQDGRWRTPHPPYPKAALAAHAAGSVTFETRTDSKGKIARVKIIKPAGTALLDRYTQIYVKDHWSGPPSSRHTWSLAYRLN